MYMYNCAFVCMYIHIYIYILRSEQGQRCSAWPPARGSAAAQHYRAQSCPRVMRFNDTTILRMIIIITIICIQL